MTKFLFRPICIGVIALVAIAFLLAETSDMVKSASADLDHMMVIGSEINPAHVLIEERHSDRALERIANAIEAIARHSAEKVICECRCK